MTLRPSKNPEMLYRLSSDENAVIVDLELEEYFWELDGLACDLWKDIDGIRTWGEIKDLHRVSFDPEDGDFDQLSDELLNDLAQAKIILLNK